MDNGFKEIKTISKGSLLDTIGFTKFQSAIESLSLKYDHEDKSGHTLRIGYINFTRGFRNIEFMFYFWVYVIMQLIEENRTRAEAAKIKLIIYNSYATSSKRTMLRKVMAKIGLTKCEDSSGDYYCLPLRLVKLLHMFKLHLVLAIIVFYIIGIISLVLGNYVLVTVFVIIGLGLMVARYFVGKKYKKLNGDFFTYGVLNKDLAEDYNTYHHKFTQKISS